MRVAFLGMGIMGRPMAANLVKAGHEVSTWNRSPGKDLEGARSAPNPADAARGAEVVWMCVSDTKAVESVLFGPGGAEGSLAEGMIAGMSVGLFTLQSADVKSVMSELDKAFGTPDKSPLAGLLRIIPIERMNALLVVTPQPAYLDEAKKWIERLDKGGAHCSSELPASHRSPPSRQPWRSGEVTLFRPGAALAAGGGFTIADTPPASTDWSVSN